MDAKPLALLLFLVTALTAACQPAPITLAAGSVTNPGRTISVTGTAELLTAPDEFIVSVGAESFALEPDAAKAENDRVMKALLATASSLDVSEKLTRTDNFTMAPRYEGPWESRRLVGYDVKKTLTVTVRDAARVEKLLAELFKHGANRLDGVTLASSKVVTQRKEVRTMAVSEARAKAEAMASALGQKLGRPTKIAESQEAAFRPLAANAVFDNNSRAVIHEAMATGKLQISASVDITFELVD